MLQRLINCRIIIITLLIYYYKQHCRFVSCSQVVLFSYGICCCLVGYSVVLEESPCPREPVFKSLSSDHKVLENCQGELSRSSHSAKCLLCMITREVHKFSYRHNTRGYGEEWLTY